MKKNIRYFLLLNLLAFILAIVIYAVGYEYDKAHKIYLEAYYFSYDAAIIVYGKRWERVSTILLLFCGLIDIVTMFIWYRNRQKEDKDILIFTKEKL